MVVAGGGWRWLVHWNGKNWFTSGFHCADIAYSKEIDVPFQTFVLFTCQISRNFQHFAPDFCGAADVILGQMNPGGHVIWREFRWRNSSGERPSLRWMEESFTGGVPSSELSSDDKSSWPFIDGGHCTRHRELGCVVRQWWWVVGGSLTLHGLTTWTGWEESAILFSWFSWFLNRFELPKDEPMLVTKITKVGGNWNGLSIDRCKWIWCLFDNGNIWVCCECWGLFCHDRRFWM